VDRSSGGPLIIACSEGGTSIEDLAESSPEKVRDGITVLIASAPPT